MAFVALIVWAVGVQVHELFGTIGLVALVVAWLPRARSLRLVAVKAWGPLLAFIAWALLAPTLGGSPPDGTGVARTLDWVAIPFAAATFSELDERRRGVVLLAASVTLVVSCLVAGLQHFGAWPAQSVFEGLEVLRIPFSRVYEPIGEGEDRFMGGGLLFHRLKFAHVSGLAMIPLVYAAVRVPARRVPLSLAAVFALVAVWLFPFARMGAVAATAGVAATLVLVSPSRRRAALSVGGLALVGVLAVALVAPLRARFEAALTDQGSGQRTQHLSAGLRAIREHPLVGVGPGQFRPSKFGGPEMAEHVKDNPGKAHNQFVSMAAETGVLGGLGFVALLGWLAFQARARPLGALALGALAQFVVLSLAHDPLFQAPYSMGLVLVLGVGLSSSPSAEAPAA